MARAEPHRLCRENASAAPYQIPIPRSSTTRNTSWSSSPSRSSIPLTPRSICTMCFLYTLFLVGLLCASSAVFYLVEECAFKDDTIVTATSVVTSTTPVDATTDCNTTKAPVRPILKTTPTTTTAKATTTTKSRTTITTKHAGEDSSSCSDSNSTADHSNSNYNLSTNSSSSETTTLPHPPLDESHFDSGTSTSTDCVTPRAPTESGTDDSITTVSSSSDSKTQIPAKPSSQTSTDCSTSVKDTEAVGGVVGGENKAGASVGSGSKSFL